MTKMRILLIVAISLVVNSVSGQIVFENREGNKQFLPLMDKVDKNPGLIKINTGDKSIGFDYYLKLGTSNNEPNFLNFSLNAKSTTGLGAFINNGTILPGFQAEISYLKMKLFDTDKTKPENKFIDWFSVSAGYEVGKYKLYNSNLSIKDQLEEKVFGGFNSKLGYNALWNSKILTTLLIGAKRANNSSDLDEIEVIDYIESLDTNNGVTRRVEMKNDALSGEFLENTQFPLSLSIGYLTEQGSNKPVQIGLLLYSNLKISKERAPVNDFGTFIYLSNPTNDKEYLVSPVIAINIEFRDAFDTKKKGNKFYKRLFVGVTSNLRIF